MQSDARNAPGTAGKDAPRRQGADMPALTPTAELRQRARQRVMEGAVTANYDLDPQQVIGMLQQALATELVCVLRYRRHYYVAKGIKARFAATEFKEHSDEEAGHADRIAERIVQLGGDPDFNPQGLLERSHAQYHAGKELGDMITEDLVAERIVQLGGDPDFNPQGLLERSHAQYHAGKELGDMITEDLVAERIAIESYREMVQFIGERDPTTRRMLEEILAVEEEHADDLTDLLEGEPKVPKRA
jgi:bacterioferritin